MRKILTILFLISVVVIAGCQLQKDLQPQEETQTPTTDSIAKDLESTEEKENIDDIEVLIDENTF